MNPAMRDAAARALHVIEPDGTVHTASKAVLHVYEHLGWRVSTAVLGTPPLSWGVEGAYRVFANNRRFFARWIFWEAHPDVEDL